MVYAMLCKGEVCRHIGVEVHRAPSKCWGRFGDGKQNGWTLRVGYTGYLAGWCERQAGWFHRIPLLHRTGWPLSAKLMLRVDGYFMKTDTWKFRDLREREIFYFLQKCIYFLECFVLYLSFSFSYYFKCLLHFIEMGTIVFSKLKSYYIGQKGNLLSTFSWKYSFNWAEICM